MQEEQNQPTDETPVDPNQMTDTSSEGSEAQGDQPAAATTGAERGAETGSDAEAEPAAGRQGGGRKVRQGLVVSNKMSKSIVVAVVRRVRHPLYKKYFNKTKKYMAHDEADECNVGDTVRIVETRPLSARKRWRLDAIVEKAK